MGFEYLCATDKTEFLNNIDKFVKKGITEKPILFEVFTDSDNESEALRLIHHIRIDKKAKVKENAKNFVKSILGEKGVEQIKKIIGKGDK